MSFRGSIPSINLVRGHVCLQGSTKRISVHRWKMATNSRGVTFEEVQHLVGKVIIAQSADEAHLDSQPAQGCRNICRSSPGVWSPAAAHECHGDLGPTGAGNTLTAAWKSG